PSASPSVATASPLPTPTPTPVPTPLVSSRGSIVVKQPLANSRVHSPLTIAGDASVFEANLSWQGTDTAGRVPAKGFTPATPGARARGPWSGADDRRRGRADRGTGDEGSPLGRASWDQPPRLVVVPARAGRSRRVRAACGRGDRARTGRTRCTRRAPKMAQRRRARPQEGRGRSRARDH